MLFLLAVLFDDSTPHGPITITLGGWLVGIIIAAILALIIYAAYKYFSS